MHYNNSIHAVTREKAIKELADNLDHLHSSEIAELYSTMMNSVDTIVVLDKTNSTMRRLVAASDPYHQGEQVDVCDDDEEWNDKLKQSELDEIANRFSN